MKPLLLVLNPRRIEHCIAAIEKLDIDRAWLTNYTETQLEDVVPRVLSETDHDPILCVSDDTVPTQAALDAVLSLTDDWPVVTGYCNLDATSEYVNLTKHPFTSIDSHAGSYSFFTHAEVRRRRVPVRTWFAGMSLTAMSRKLWTRYPFKTYRGRSSDFALSLRLQEDKVPIVAPPQSFIHHVKEQWNLLDKAPEKRLLIGREPSGVRYDLRGTRCRAAA